VAEILRYNPLRFVREAYVRFIQGLFSMAPKGWYHWELDNEETDIIISDENPIKTDTLGKRPCITCTRAPVAFYTLGLDDLLEYNMSTGARKKSVLLPGTMSINCCSRVPLEAEQLAWIVAEHLWMLRDVMRRWGFYDIGRNLTIGAPSPPGAIIQNDSGDEWYVVTITSPFQMHRMSEVTPLGARVAQEMDVIMGGELPPRIPQGMPNGYAIYSMTSGSGSDELPSVGGRVNTPPGSSSISPHSVRTMAHPLNPAVQVTVRAARPGDPAVRQPTIRGRTIPIRSANVEESSGEQLKLQTRVIKT